MIITPKKIKKNNIDSVLENIKEKENKKKRKSNKGE